MIKFGVDASEFVELENTLDRLSEKAIPNAVRNTLNTLARETSDKARATLPSLFTLRNKHASNSIRAYSCRERRKINSMFSEAGSIAGYLAAQEEGFTVSGGPNVHDPKQGVAIPTGSAAGQPSGKRTGAKQAPRRLTRLKPPFVPPMYAGKSPKQNLLVALNQALKAKAKTVILGKQQGMTHLGVYAVGQAQYEGRGWAHGLTIGMLYMLDKSSTVTPPHRWLEPASDQTARSRADVYIRMMERQLAMERAFRAK